MGGLCTVSGPSFVYSFSFLRNWEVEPPNKVSKGGRTRLDKISIFRGALLVEGDDFFTGLRGGVGVGG